jgi:hypothetical protein
MSISTASACRPEISRRPTISTAFTAPSATIAPTKSHSSCESWGRSALSTTWPVSQISAICAACDPTASTIDTTSETRYGRRKPSRRKNVLRYGTALTVEI